MPRRAGKLALFGVLALVVLYATRDFAAHPALAWALEKLAPPLADVRLSVGEIHGDWFRSLGVRDLELASGPPEEPELALSVRELSLSLSIAGLLDGDAEGVPWWLRACRGIRVRGLELSTRATPEEDTGEQIDWPALPDRLPRIDLEGATLDLELAPRELLRIRVESLRSRAPLGTDHAGDELALNAPLIAYLAPELERTIEDASLRVQYADGIALVTSLRLEGEELVQDRSTVDLSRLQEREIAWTLALQAAGGLLHVEGTTTDLDLDVRAEGARLDLAAIAALLAPEDPLPLAGLVDLQAALQLPYETPEASEAVATASGRALRYEASVIDSAEIRAAWREGAIVVDSLEARQAANELEVRDLRLPLHGPDIDEWSERLLAATGALRIAARDVPALVGLFGAEARGPIPEHEVELSAELGGGELAITSGFLVTPGGRLDVQRGLLAPPESPDEDWRLALDARAAFDDLAPLGAITGTEPWAGTLAGDVHFEGALPTPRGSASLHGEAVRVAGYPLGTVDAEIEIDPAVLRVLRLHASSEAGSLDASGSILLEAERYEDVALKLDLEAPDRLAEAKLGLGPLVVDLELEGPWSAPTGYAIVRGERITTKWAVLEDMDAELLLEEGTVVVRELSARAGEGGIYAVGSVDLPNEGEPLRIELQRLSLRSGAGALDLAEPTGGSIAEGRIEWRPAVLSGTAGTLRLAALSVGTETDVRVVVEEWNGAPLDLIEGSFLPSSTFASCSFAYVTDASGARLDTDGKVRVEGTVFGVPDPQASWDVAIAGGVAEIEQLEAFARDGVRVIARGRAPFRLETPTELPDGSLELHADLALPLVPWVLALAGREAEVRGVLAAEAELGGSWERLEGVLTLAGSDLLPIATSDGVVRGLAEVPQPGSASGKIELGETIRLSELRLLLPERFDLDATGSIGAPLEPRALIAGEAELLDAKLELAVEGKADDLAWIAPHVATIRRLAGKAELDVVIAGTPRAPQWSGALAIREGELRLAADVPSIDAIRADVRLEPEAIVLESCTAELGASKVALAGSVALEDGTAPVLDLSLTGDNVLLQRTANIRLRAGSNLTLKGPLDAMRLAGKVEIRNSRLAQTVDLLPFARGGSGPELGRGLQLFSLRDDPLASMQLDVQVSTAEPFRIESNLARGAVRLDLHLSGTGEVPLPVGRVFVEPTRVRLPGGTLEVTAGTVTFTEANPFVPELDIFGETRLWGYDVTVRVGGTIEEPEVVLSSSPPLPRDELVMLVLTGRRPTGSVREQGVQAAQSVAIYVAKDLVRQWMSEGLSEGETFLDRLDLVAGREVSKGGTETIEASFLLAKDVLAEDDELRLTAERDVYEEFNFGLRIVFRFE